MMVRIAAALFLLCGLVAAQAQQFGSAEFAIKDDEGDPIANHSLTPEQKAKFEELRKNRHGGGEGGGWRSRKKDGDATTTTPAQ